MLNLKTSVLFVLPVLLSQALPSVANSLPGLYVRSASLPALLRGPTDERSNGNKRRQDNGTGAGTCAVGSFACTDGKGGCCDNDQYCGTWGGVPGCCPNGETCVANGSPCEYAGDVLCENYNFCCPAGDTCSVDASGNPLCNGVSETGTSATSTAVLGGAGVTTTSTVVASSGSDISGMSVPTLTAGTSGGGLPSISAPTFTSSTTTPTGDAGTTGSPNTGKTSTSDAPVAISISGAVLAFAVFAANVLTL